MRRVAEALLAALGILILSPIFLLLAIVILLDSRGPVFFRQERVGRGGRKFRIHKFRTMSTSDSGPLVTSATDPRITQIGKLLRKYRLDELPQLFDVLRGDMAFVGPRPEVPHYIAFYSPEDAAVILSTRPGITDPAALAFRNEGDSLAHAADPEAMYIQELLPKKIAMYKEYIQKRTLTSDLRVLWDTVGVLIGREPKGSYGDGMPGN